ncbi:MAG TPA: protealysin inhibitor emfourin [Nitrososphaeraceae archaeon]|nr:protealysin inhibitor emfourin [Nitrososphaeraceae archaeon]
MKIHFKQSGGLAGIDNDISINSNLLQLDEQFELQRLIANAKFFDLPSQPELPLRGADYFEYKITIETNDNKKHSIKTTDLSMPPNIGPLIVFLRQKALKKTSEITN